MLPRTYLSPIFKKLMNGLKLMLFSSLLWACNTPPSSKELLAVDREFSAASLKDGMRAAFLTYADTSAVILRPKHPPIRGRANIAQFFPETPLNYHLTWEPQEASIAASGDLGYTYGIYTVTQENRQTHGTYVTIWKKNKKGDWKFVLDTGNQGLKP